MSAASRRARRRARARLRDRMQHGTDDRALAPRPAPITPETHSTFRAMLPARVVPTKTSATHRERVVLQRIDAGRPKGKRTVRYTTTIEWGGGRVKGPGLPDPKE